MSFRILNQNPQYLTADGKVLAGGSLTFSISGTSTPLYTYNSPYLATANANPVTLDSAGRATTDIWGNGNYRIVAKDSLGTVQWTKDNVKASGGGDTTIPSLVSGSFLTNDGTNLTWAPVLQIPDPSGQNNKILGTDGTNITWVTKPISGINGDPGTNAAVSATTTKYLVGDGTTGHDQVMMQMGSASAPASGGHTTSASITFPAAFKAISGVWATVTSGSIASAGYLVAIAVTVKSPTGFSVAFDTNSSDGSNGNIIGAIPFDWIAVGTLEQ